jgi:carbon-monoxide dehydrogenase medium subunit
MGVGDMPIRLSKVEAMLEGREVGQPLIHEAVEIIREQIEPNSDLNASAEYRRHLAGALARRALRDAWARTEAGVS